ncbi:flagellar assembly protein FliH [Litoreibacter halocynthiae]|uniref:Flagellar assembly protein FliH n=1 Tax=Litoreibacter halocynthiae TaxID=1242689 RepID=A0A4R7LIL0_9RHOB|nr:hypothetical protein [Litoreibacter halocynthiae]TDT73870.1 flagellar assembly protein FliH [Litoreibacter halocynthiae]
MTQASYLEDFSSAGLRPKARTQSDGANADALRASFDDGYKCGWQDAAAATQDQDRETREGLSSALQVVNFTYFEAREHVMQSVRPVLDAMVEVILPRLLAKSIGGRIVEVLADAADGIETTITIACAPESTAMLEELVADTIKFPVIVKAEPTLTASQATVHLGDGQARIDLDATLDDLRDAINTFFGTPKLMEAEHA